MTPLSSLRARLVGTVFLAIAPAWIVMYLFAYDPPWMRFAVGLLALGAAWYGGEKFVMRQVRCLLKATRLLASGDLSIRTGLDAESHELGELARDIDQMAAALQKKALQQGKVEGLLLSRALQQTVVSALGQFALVSSDLQVVFNHAVMMVAQTLEVEYCHILQLQPDGKSLLLKAGVGWKEGRVGTATVPATKDTQAGYTLLAGEPVIVDNLPAEKRFRSCQLSEEHGVVSGMTVAIGGQGRTFGVLGAHTTNPRKFNEDEVHFLLAIATMVAMAVVRHQTEADLQKLASFAELNPNPAMEIDKEGRITYFNDAASHLAKALGYNNPHDILPIDCEQIVWKSLATGKSIVGYETGVGNRTLSWSFHPVNANSVVHTYVQDITERLDLESRLRQSQKMECVGQLAAGVAHDFNNMLTIIQGHAGLLMVKPDLNEQHRDGVQAIQFASERAAVLTRQLLMFSRKNVIQPRLLDLAEITISTSKLLQRLLGETIQLKIEGSPGMLVQADAGMLEQVIMNLAVNARDAMTRGGALTISTRLTMIENPSSETHPEARSGQFVQLDVQDTGCGIPPEVMPRIFEPFFTTKEVGKGTGLGLATVYGIVKQHEGWIEVHSYPGQGTTFSIFLPACQAAEQTAAAPAPSDTAQQLPSGRETILLVEDEAILRELAQSILESCGYRVLAAGSGPEAVKVWSCQRDAIDLVLTDMVMPEGLSGMDLARQFSAEKPGVRIIFASGYSMDDLEPEFLRDHRAGFLQKPYTHSTLSRAVRELFDNGA